MGYVGKWFALLSLLLASAGLGWSQDAESVRIIGSGIVNSLIERLAESGDGAALNIETVGTAAGIDRFCSGEIEIATAIRPLTGAEQAICRANAVAYSELVASHFIVAIVAHPEAPAQCLTTAQLEMALKPSAGGALNDWSFYSEDKADLPLTLMLPDESRIAHLILDSLVAGDGLRQDAMFYEAGKDLVSAVRETAGALGFAPWSPALESDPSIALLQVGGENGECVGAAVDAVEDGSYSAALSLYLVVNRARIGDNASAAGFLDFLTDQANAPAIEAAGFIPPSDARQALNRELLAEGGAAAGDVADFIVPPDLSGQLTIAGGASAFEALNRAASSLTQTRQGLDIRLELLGRANGLERLCAGEADIAALDSQSAADDLNACPESLASATGANLGAQATVMLGNAGDAFTACLTTDQILTIWSAHSADHVDEWSQVDPAFPAVAMTLFGPTLLDSHADILLQAGGDLIPPIRRDTETDFDPLYRAAAVGNVPGALTFMNWSDYQRALDKDQANIQLVAVDAGAGCVSPAPESIADGSYALSRRTTLLTRQESLGGALAQSFLWTLLTDEQWSNVERAGFIGVSTLALPGIRRDLQSAFAEAEAKFPPVEAAPEVEPEDGDPGADDSS